MPLEKYYSGDKDWNDFVSFHRNNSMSGDQYAGNEKCFATLGLLNEEGIELLTVAISLFGLEGTLDWLNRKIPALEKETPFDCIISSQISNSIKKRMREYLMRVPV